MLMITMKTTTTKTVKKQKRAVRSGGGSGHSSSTNAVIVKCTKTHSCIFLHHHHHIKTYGQTQFSPLLSRTHTEKPSRDWTVNKEGGRREKDGEKSVVEMKMEMEKKKKKMQQKWKRKHSTPRAMIIVPCPVALALPPLRAMVTETAEQSNTFFYYLKASFFATATEKSYWKYETSAATEWSELIKLGGSKAVVKLKFIAPAVVTGKWWRCTKQTQRRRTETIS